MRLALLVTLFFNLCVLVGCSNSSNDSIAGVPAVMPVAETEPVLNQEDAADDPEIWVHPLTPEASLILGTDKQRGLDVYDLSGKRVQSIERGRLNNVDLRQGIEWAGELTDIAVASNRTRKTVDLFRIDRQDGVVSMLDEKGIVTGLNDPYGICLYHSQVSHKLYVFVNDKDGRYQQWSVSKDRQTDRMNSELVREFSLDSQPEGCVADDEQAILYLGEENLGIWRAGAEPSEAFMPQQLDKVGQGNLVADVEGMSLYLEPGGEGYLVVSSQGNNTYALYRRDANNEYLGSFQVIDNTAAGIDGASETDGLAVSSAYLGEAFPIGILVVQDGENTLPAANQNFKIINWSDVLKMFQSAK